MGGDLRRQIAHLPLETPHLGARGLKIGAARAELLFQPAHLRLGRVASRRLTLLILFRVRE